MTGGASSTSILYVEDDKNDVFFLQTALEESGLAVSLQVARDGQEGIDYLAGKGPFADRKAHPLPGLVLLDLNLPIRSGFELLAWLRLQPALKHLPVVVFSSSTLPADLQRAAELGANSYAVKPVSCLERLEFVRDLMGWWFKWHRAPSSEGGSIGVEPARGPFLQR